MNIFETHIFIVKVSMYVGVAFLISSSLLLLIILLNRIRVIAMDRRERRYVKKWRESLLDTIDNKPSNIDFVPNKHKEISLIVWNDFQDLLKGVERERLNKMAKSLSLDSFAITLLKSNKEDKKLLGVQTLGNMAEEDYFPKIENLFSNSKSLTIVLESLHTMVKINPERSVSNLLYFFKTRDYYPDYKIAVYFKIWELRYF